jgi:hypothetical protein
MVPVISTSHFKIVYLSKWTFSAPTEHLSLI